MDPFTTGVIIGVLSMAVLILGWHLFWAMVRNWLGA